MRIQCDLYMDSPLPSATRTFSAPFTRLSFVHSHGVFSILLLVITKYSIGILISAFLVMECLMNALVSIWLLTSCIQNTNNRSIIMKMSIRTKQRPRRTTSGNSENRQRVHIYSIFAKFNNTFSYMRCLCVLICICQLYLIFVFKWEAIDNICNANFWRTKWRQFTISARISFVSRMKLKRLSPGRCLSQVNNIFKAYI